MRFPLAALLCLTGALAACSHNNEAANHPGADDKGEAYPPPESSSESVGQSSSMVTPPVAAEPPRMRSASGVDTPTDVRAPLVADTKSTNASAFKTDVPPSNQAQPAPDNTKVNERDRNVAAVTPLDQRENETDLKITQNVRKAVMADGTLSFTAKNVKIITQAGKVTLRGPVKSAQERDAIDAAARKVAGVTQVDNQIEVKK